MSEPDPPPRPASPRSPRPASDNNAADTPPTTTPRPLNPPVFPGAFIEPPGPPPPRSSFQSLMMMMMMFWFFSSGNQPGGPGIVVGPDGELHRRVTQLDMANQTYVDYRDFLNGTGNWTEPAAPVVQPSSLVPSRYDHSGILDSGGSFFTNITGWYRRAKSYTVDIATGDSAPLPSPFFSGINVPSVNATGSSWNATLADELRGEFNWSTVNTWDLHMTERPVEAATMVPPLVGASDWAWARGSITLTTEEQSQVDYAFYGLHHIPNGTYELFGLPDGIKIDIRNIPTLYPRHHNETAHLILAELRKELKTQEDSLLLTDVRQDDFFGVVTRCPLVVHISLPPLPAGVDPKMVSQYAEELEHPTGIRTSLAQPPNYWDREGPGIVAIAEECGWAFGVEHGRGVLANEFLRKSINYAAFATISQLLVLVLFVRQMESTRTPSTLAKVSMWTFVILGVCDATLSSLHIMIGVVNRNRASLPMIVPGFFALCTGIIFAPRYALLLSRIQAPERATPRTTGARATGSASGGAGGVGGAAGEGGTNDDEPQLPFLDRFINFMEEYPMFKWLGVLLAFVLVFQIVRVPSIVPFLLFLAQSLWIPQIWRNARRGSNNALSHRFVVGTSIGRLALPLYAYACPENVLFSEPADWIYLLIVWNAAQIAVLFAQDRFGPAFFLPARLSPPPAYDYHPLMPAMDAENAVGDGGGNFEGGTTCSICMEEVDTRPAVDEGGSVLGGLGRRGYAVAPCHHLFHTKCLQQWMAIKTICPLCKRTLPPL